MLGRTGISEGGIWIRRGASDRRSGMGRIKVGFFA